MNPFDAAALFWWARKSLFFDPGLDRRSALARDNGLRPREGQRPRGVQPNLRRSEDALRRASRKAGGVFVFACAWSGSGRIGQCQPVAAALVGTWLRLSWSRKTCAHNSRETATTATLPGRHNGAGSSQRQTLVVCLAADRGAAVPVSWRCAGALPSRTHHRIPRARLAGN
jgi:hypothetical protein